jgi:two-component system repressor protein LuxO
VVVLNQGKEIELSMLPPPLNEPAIKPANSSNVVSVSFGPQDIQPLWKTEKTTIEQAIEACDGNIPQAAKHLDVSPSTIYRKIQAWNASEKKA